MCAEFFNPLVQMWEPVLEVRVRVRVRVRIRVRFKLDIVP
jgi:hypothetical protein